MKKEALSQFANPDLILMSFLLLFSVFIYLLYKLFLKTPKKEMEKQALIPFYEKTNSQDKELN